MVHRRSMLARAPFALAVLALPLVAFPLGVLPAAGQPATVEPASSAVTSARSVADGATTLLSESFESGAQAWSTNRGAKIRTVDRGRRSKSAARLRASENGKATARTTVAAAGAAGGRHIATAWLRSDRGTVRAKLFLREVEPATGEVLSRSSDRLRAGKKWKRAKVAVTRTTATSVFNVSVRSRQRLKDRVLLDSVGLRRKGGDQPAMSPPSGPPAAGGFPDASNTGVPEGLALTPYTGPMTVTSPGTVIDAKQITGTLVVRAPNVTISRSNVAGSVYVEKSGSLSMSDSTVDGGTSENAAIGQYNFVLRRVEVLGARVSVGCNANCDVADSWLHAQYMKPGSDWHGDGFLSNGGTNMVLRHNTLACDSEPTGSGGACSAAIAVYGDFSPITNLTVDNNFFAASPAGYCMYGGYDPAKPFGGQAQSVSVTNNVFARGSNGKCAAFGPVTAVAPQSTGSAFSGNVWEDGRTVQAR